MVFFTATFKLLCLYLSLHFGEPVPYKILSILHVWYSRMYMAHHILNGSVSVYVSVVFRLLQVLHSWFFALVIVVVVYCTLSVFVCVFCRPSSHSRGFFHPPNIDTCDALFPPKFQIFAYSSMFVFSCCFYVVRRCRHFCFLVAIRGYTRTYTNLFSQWNLDPCTLFDWSSANCVGIHSEKREKTSNMNITHSCKSNNKIDIQ